MYRKPLNSSKKSLNLSPKDVLVVEDSTLGIRAVKSAGLMVAALVQKDYYIDQSEADFQINDLIEVIDISIYILKN